jgi:hypothetical protein
MTTRNRESVADVERQGKERSGMVKGIGLPIGLLLGVCVLLVLASCGPAASNESATATPSSAGEARVTPGRSPSSATTAAQVTTYPAAEATLTASEVAMRSASVSQSVKSLAFDMDFCMSLGLPGMGTMTMRETGTGWLNLSERQMDINMDMTMDMPGRGKQNANGEVIATDGWLYMKAAAVGSPEQWTRMRLTEEMWAAQSRFASLTDFLKTPISVEAAGQEVVGGIDCYVLAITPDTAALSNWVASQAQSGQSGAGIGTADLSARLTNFTVKEWVAKDSHLPVKAVVSIKMDPSSSQDADAAMEMSVSMVFHDYGKTVRITLPAEALSARELTTTK